MESAKERNRQIYEEWLNGTKWSDLAKKYSLTVSRIKEICQREKKREAYQENDIYQLMTELCDDEKLVTRTFTVLKRIGATTAKDIVKLDRNILKKTQNCGVVMEVFIMKIKEMIEYQEK